MPFFDGTGSWVWSGNTAEKSWLGDDAAWTTLDEGGARGGGYTFATRKSLSKTLSPEECYRLSIAVNAAVNAIARNISKAKIRLFTKNGEEINGGPLYELLRRPAAGMSQRKWLWEAACWLNIAGELPVWAQENAGQVNALPILCPTQLFIKSPVVPPRSIDEVVQWRYRWADGGESLIRGDHLLFERLFNTDHASVRGLSPLVTGTVEVTAQHNASLYNKTFFDNNAIPSHILKLPDGVPEATRKDIERRYLSEHGVYGNNAHKTFVISGNDAEFMPIEQPFQEAAFVELQKRVDYKVGQLYRVPAIELGIYDKTRFDTAAEERKLFVESTLMPQIDALTEMLQHGLVDRFFGLSQFTVSRPRATRKPVPDGTQGRKTRFERMVEKAMDERPTTGRIVLLIDADTMPVMGDVRLAKMEHAEKLQKTYKLSANQTAEYLGDDLPDEGADEPARTNVFTENNLVDQTDPERNKKFVPGLIPKPAGEGAGAGASGGAKPPSAKSDDLSTPLSHSPHPVTCTPESREKIEKAQKFLRELRRRTIDRMVGDEELWSLSEADSINELGPEMAKEIRLLRYEIRKVVKQHADKESRIAATKELFKSLSAKSHLRKALNL